MPIYTFICKDCSEKFDLLVGMTSEKIEIKCKKCGSRNLEKSLGSFNVGNGGDKSSFGSTCPTGTCPSGP